MAIQRFATTRFGADANQGGGIRRLASRLPEIYAQKNEQDFREENIQLQKDAFKEQKKVAGQQHESEKRGEGVALGTLGLSGGIAALKYKQGLDPNSTAGSMLSSRYGQVGIGGITGGMAGGGIAKGLGAKKRWQKSMAGALGGAAFTAMAGGDALSIGGGALLGGAMGALF